MESQRQGAAMSAFSRHISRRAALQGIGAGFLLPAVGAALAACSGSQASVAHESHDTHDVLNVPSHLWASGPDLEYMDLLEKLTKKKYPDSGIDKQLIPFADYFDKVYTLMASGQAPDVAIAYDAQMVQWVQQGLLEPLDPWLSKAGFNVDKMIAAEKIAVVNGKVYGLLGFTNPRVLIYNKRLFSTAGLVPPTSPTAWRKAAEAITDPAKGIYGAALVTGGSSPTDIYQYLVPIIAGFGGAFVTNGKPTATDPKVVNALSFIKGLYDDHLVPAGVGSADIVDAYEAGKIGSVVTGPFLVPAAQQAQPKSKADFDLAKVPFNEPAVSVNVYFTMPKGAKHQDLAAAFILGTVNPQTLDLTINTQQVPPGVPTDVPSKLLATAPYLTEVMTAAKTAVSYSPSGVGKEATDVMNDVGDAFQAMLVSGVSPENTAQQINDKLSQLLAK